MAVIDNSHIIIFPESNYNNKGYYLLNIDFAPRYSQKTNYSSSNRANGDFNANTNSDFDIGYYDASGSSTTNGDMDIDGNTMGNASSHNVEMPSTALLTIAPIDLSRTIHVQLNGVQSKNINYLKHYFLLGKIEQQKLGLR